MKKQKKNSDFPPVEKSADSISPVNIRTGS